VVAAATAGNVRDTLGGAVDALAATGVETPRLDAELLLAEATGWDRTRLAAEPGDGVPAGAGRRFAEMVRRRLQREPVAYILGRKGFRSLELVVDPRVLIPRPETELLVELAVELRPERVLDVGTGSGAVALAIAAELPECEAVATDTSSAALEVARANAERLGLAERVRFAEGTLPGKETSLEGTLPSGETGWVGGEGAQAFDLIVANLPYVAASEWADLQPEVKRWEPCEALLAGPDGLDAIRALLADRAGLGSVLSGGTSGVTDGTSGGPGEGGALALEVGAGQAEAVGELLAAAGFTEVAARPDLAGIPRLIWGRP
jgi:release factor glutamine methyltransferase